MGAETNLVSKKGKDFGDELRKERISNSNRSMGGRRRKTSASMRPVQRLYETCRQVFASAVSGMVPSAGDIERLKLVLDDMKPDDFGLTPEMPYFRKMASHRVPAIAYLHLYECDQFSMGIFCLPPSAVIPLHNHPGMTVFSKLLFGTMHIKSYDWVDNIQCDAVSLSKPTNAKSLAKPMDVEPPSSVRLAKLKVNSNFAAPCNTSILYPADGGNMHEFTAVTACAVLDVLGPPYSDPDGRHCQYYLDYPFTNISVDGVSVPEDEQEGHAWLQEREKPDDLAVIGALYRGPKLVQRK